MWDVVISLDEEDVALIRPPRCSMISTESAESKRSPLKRVGSRAWARAATAKGGQLRGEGEKQERRAGRITWGRSYAGMIAMPLTCN